MAYDANVAALQSVINRFAAIGGYSKIAVDGAFGPNTRQGTFKALATVQRGTCASSGCPSDEDQATATSLVAQWDGEAGAARGLQMFLSGVADMMGLAHVATPTPTPAPSTFPSSSTLPANPFATTGSLLATWNGLPFWQRVALGVVAGVGLLWAHKQWKLRHAPRTRKGRR